jgi:hypothetical protein
MIPSDNLHDYLSTACYHKMHWRCRQFCKFCGVPCKCECHAKKVPVESRYIPDPEPEVAPV